MLKTVWRSLYVTFKLMGVWSLVGIYSISSYFIILWFIFFRFLDQFNGYNDFNVLTQLIWSMQFWIEFWQRQYNMNQFILTKKFAYSLLKMGAFLSLFVLQVEEILIYSSLKMATFLAIFWKCERFWQSFSGNRFVSLLKVGAPD
jgi:hypothetical protein